MRRLRVVLLVCGSLGLPGCYDFKFPLDPQPMVPVDSRLIGAWRCLGAEDGDEGGVIRVERRNEQVSRWTFEEPASDVDSEKREAEVHDEREEFDVHGSTVKGGQLLSAQAMKDGEPGSWSFVRYSFLLPYVLRLQLVEGEPFKEVKDDAKALRKAVEKRRNDPVIYYDYLICVRAKPSPDPSPSPTPEI